jgi:hypothetical protein
MPASKIPFLIKHVALAIYESGDVIGSTPTQKITGALDIARHRLVEYGFLYQGSETGPVEDIKLTAKGKASEQKHKVHGPKAKNLKFDTLYALIASAHEDEEANTAGDDPSDAEFSVSPTARKQRIQARHARAAKSRAKPRKSVRAPKRVRRIKNARRA